jgi:DNA-binding response OmpR family regulator
MRLLLLEDDDVTAGSLVAGLRQRGFSVEHAATCGDALARVARGRFDVAVLDLMVPGGSGYDVLRALRAGQPGVRVLILSARDGVEERVEGLGRGADDYLVKPFALAELAARLQALLRRPSWRVETTRIRGVEIDPLHRRVTVGERRVDLTRVEFDLLLALAEQRGGVATRRHLLEAVWGYRFEPGTNVVDVHVAHVRRKLEEAGGVGLIRTVRGVGYAVED